MIKQLSAIDCWTQGWVVIAVRPVTQNRWFKHWCCQLKLRVVLLDKALIVIVWVHPAGIGYRHLLGVNLQWTGVPIQRKSMTHICLIPRKPEIRMRLHGLERSKEDTDWCFIVIASFVWLCVSGRTLLVYLSQWKIMV